MDTIEYLPLYMLSYALAYYYMFGEKRSDALWSFVSGLIGGAIIYFFAMDSLASRGFNPMTFSLTILIMIVGYRAIKAIAMWMTTKKRHHKKRMEIGLTDEEIDKIVEEVLAEMDEEYYPSKPKRDIDNI